jgi:hypothetical protein
VDLHGCAIGVGEGVVDAATLKGLDEYVALAGLGGVPRSEWGGRGSRQHGG